MKRSDVNYPFLALAFFLQLNALAGDVQGAEGGFRPVPLQSRITGVQPMTGIVFWADSEHNSSDAIQLEYSYCRYNDIVCERGKYDWSKLEKLLDGIAGRKHQAILRFYDTYPGQKTTVPDYIKKLPDYKETYGKSEKQDTVFPDWSHAEWKRFIIEFYSKFAERYDRDRRLAFLETGFGLWAEYHIYDGPLVLGRTFPDTAFQTEFLKHLGKVFRETPWMISVDAADGEYSPLDADRELLKLPFGLFDDSFLCKQHPKVNEKNWNFFSRDRYLRTPAGGEFSYYNKRDQREALSPQGPNGVPFARAAGDFHITFMIGSDQPQYQKMNRIREAGQICGYRFRVKAFETDGKVSRLTVANEGVAPLYHDAFMAVNGVRARESLKGLAPETERLFEVAAPGLAGKVSIESDHLVLGQRIEFNADLAIKQFNRP
jgi:hypothetical protein